MITVLYIFSGERKSRIQGRVSLDYPDTQFYGLHYLDKTKIKSEYKEFSDFFKHPLFSQILGFRIKHCFLFFATFKYDIVFGPSILYMLFWKKIFRSKQKFVLLNISFNRILLVHAHHPLRLRTIKWLAKEISYIICLSKNQAQYLACALPAFKEQIGVIHLGVDTTFHSYKRTGRKSFILAAGRDNGRDYRTVIKTAKLLPERKFIIVCSPRNVKNEQIPKNVNVHFNLSILELKELYQSAALLLLTTHNDEHVEGSDCSGQTVLLDAMANGLPVVATEKSYIIEYASNKKSIFLIPPYDENAAVEKIKLLDSLETSNRIASAARQNIEKNFSSEIMGKKLSTLFLNIKKNNE